MKIEFDPKKHAKNLDRHKIDLSEVEGVFFDQFALQMEDFDHDEQRFLVLGVDGFARLLVVCYTYREPDIIRLISARNAEPHEAREYAKGLPK